MTSRNTNVFRSMVCANCGKKIPFDEMEQVAIIGMAKLGETSLDICCTKCLCHSTINPAAMMAGVTAPPTKGDFMYRCPELGCPGYVCKIESGKKKVWMCGECGQTWKTMRGLETAISRIVSRFPYRAHAYLRQGERLLPVSKEPRNYERNVEKELAEAVPEKESRQRPQRTMSHK